MGRRAWGQRSLIRLRMLVCYMGAFGVDVLGINFRPTYRLHRLEGDEARGV